MILLVFFAVLIPPVAAKFDRLHLSDILRVKCDSLLYRTAYIDNRCYFVDFNQVSFSEAAKKCSSIFPGSKVATAAAGSVFEKMRINKSNFHTGLSSAGVKRTICVFDALKWGGPAWIRVEYRTPNRNWQTDDNWRSLFKWYGDKFGRYSTCPYDAPMVLAPIPYERRDRLFCFNSFCGQATVLESTGYWYSTFHFLSDPHHWTLMKPNETVCVADADSEFVHRSQIALSVTTNEAKVTPISLKAPCAVHHAPDSTGECRWTAPKEACAQLIDFYNRTWFTPMPNFPRETYTEIAMDIPYIPVADVTVKVIVRRGCMFFGYMHPKSGHPLQEAVSISHRTYGEHKVPCQLTGELKDIYDGISRVNCFCDPTEATLNGHVPAPPPGKQCIEHHEYNDATKACEWKFESKFCGELITHDDRRQMLEIPNWPSNRRYDVEHWNNITEIIVRQHCWATLYWRGHHERFTLATSGYGKHKVASKYNGMLSNKDEGTHRVVCECIR